MGGRSQLRDATRLRPLYRTLNYHVRTFPTVIEIAPIRQR